MRVYIPPKVHAHGTSQVAAEDSELLLVTCDQLEEIRAVYPAADRLYEEVPGRPSLLYPIAFFPPHLTLKHV